MTKRRFKEYELETGCGVEACLEVVGGKWKGLILHHLMQHGTLRFNQLQKLKPNLSPDSNDRSCDSCSRPFM